MALKWAENKHCNGATPPAWGVRLGIFCLTACFAALIFNATTGFAQQGADTGLGDVTHEEIIEMTEDEEPQNPVLEAVKAQEAAEESDYFLKTDSKANGSSKIEFIDRPEDTLFILELALDEGAVLDPGMLVFIEDDDLLIPLSVITSAMMFPIEVDTAKGQASGWFINEENTFELNYPYTSVSIAGESQPNAGIVENQIEDIYVSASTLEAWFPIKLTMNFNELRLYLEPLEDLPFQELAARRSRWNEKRSQSTANRFDLNDPDIIFLPYHQYAAPSIQLQHNLSASKQEDGVQGVLTNSIQTQGDLLRMSSRFNASTSYDSEDGKLSIDNTYFNLSKKDFRGGLAGPLNATEVELGDITANAFPLALGLRQGRGAFVSNAPSNFVRDSNDFFIEGFAPEGWDAEVYLNERLIDFQTVGTDGRYLFEDLQLREGFNLFRIQLYGPNGEQEERFERFYLGRNMIEPGQFVYEASVLQSSTPFFNALQSESLDDTDPTLSLFGEYGLTEGLSINGGYYFGPDGVSDLNALGAGARFSTDRAYFQLNSLADASGAYSASADVTANVTDKITGVVGHVEHVGFERSQRPVVQRSFVSFNRPFSILNFVDYGAFTIGGEREVSSTGVVTYRLNNILSGNVGKFSITNSLEYEVLEQNGQEELEGDFTLRRRTPIGTLRARLNYDLLDEDTLINGLELLYQTQLSRETFINMAINTSFVGDEETRLTASLNRRFEKFVLSTTGAINNEGDANIGMGLTYNFIPKSLYGDYMLSSDSGDMSLGQLQLRSFLDVNENGIFDMDETPIEGVELRNMQRGRRGTTGEDGKATLTGLSPNVVNEIIVKPETIPSIYMTPASNSLKVYGRTGINGPVDYPFILLGEISGMLYTYDAAAENPDDRIIPMTGTEIFLLDEDEKVVAQTYSEYDGFWVIPSLRMGTYQIYIPPSDALAEKYQGDGLGPQITLNQQQTEALNTDIIVLNNRIVPVDGINPDTDIIPVPLIDQQMANANDTNSALETDDETRILPTPTTEARKTAQPSTPLKAKAVPPSQPLAVTDSKINENKPLFVQVGVFCNRINAQRQFETLLIAGYEAAMKPVKSGNKDCVAVQAGPSSSMSRIADVRNYIDELGYKGPYISN